MGARDIVTRRCAEASLAAGESLGATATTAEEWLVLEAPGSWPRDVGADDALPSAALGAVRAWTAAGKRRLLFVRRPGRSRGSLLAFVVTATESAADVRRLSLRTHEDLATVDLETAGEPAGSDLVLVCGHGARDRCCAVLGTIVYRALAGSRGEEELWLSSHQGGHRFAANVLVLPAGIQLGRLPPERAAELVERALRGEIDLEHYRGRTCYAPPVQAAERAVRLAHGLTRLDALALLGVEGDVVRFRSDDGRDHAAVVEQASGPVVPASCGAPAEVQLALAARVV